MPPKVRRFSHRLVLGAYCTKCWRTITTGTDGTVERVAVKAVEEVSEEMSNAASDAAAETMKQHGESLGGFMSNVQTNVFDAITAQSVGPQGFVENLQGARMILNLLL